MLPAERDGQPDPEPVPTGHAPTQDQGLPGHIPGHLVDTTCNERILNGRIGKVVVAPSHEGLQVDESDPCFGGTAADEQVGTATSTVTKTGKELTTSSSPPGKPRPKWKLILVLVSIVLVITAAVVGGVLGSRSVASNTSSSQSTPDSPSPTDTVTGPPSLIKQGSSLSVTAWRKDQGLEMFLYYQGLDGRLRSSTYDDTKSSFTYNASYWSESSELEMSSLADLAANDTSLAATIVLWGTEYQPQIDLVYFQSNAGVCTVYNTNNDSQYQPWTRLNSFEIFAATGISLAGYWPYFARLDVDNAVAMWRNSPPSEVDYSQSGTWSNWNMSDIEVMAGSKLAVVPLGANMTSLTWWGNYGLFYQARNGNLAYIQPYRDDAAKNHTLIDSSPSDAVFPSIPLAPGGSFAAFTAARPDTSEGLVDTYVLYQEPSSRISMLYLDNKSQWATKKPVSLSIADNGTDIACVTMPMTQRDTSGNDLDLEEPSARVNRCYFQRAGHVIEVALSDTDWTELGTVPID